MTVSLQLAAPLQRLSRLSLRRATALAVVYLLLAAQPAAAVDTTWTLDGDGNWNVPANWDNGEPTNDTFDVFIDDGDSAVTVTLNVIRAIGNLTIGDDDQLSFINGIDLTVNGGAITNDGIILMNSAGGATDFIIGGNTSLTGGGTLRLSNHPNNRLFGASAIDTLTNDTNHEIEGAGQLGTNRMGLINLGLIDANQINALLIDPGDADVDGSGNDVRNDGTLQASAGGRLELGGGLFNNAGGTIQAIDASIVRLLAGAHVKNGTFTSTGTGAVELQTGSTIEDVTNTGTIRMINSQDTTLVGTITNNGTVEQNSGGGATDVTISGEVTLTGPGTWTMTNHPNNRWLGGAATDVLTHAANHTIEGAGQLGTNLMGLINHGLIDANQANALRIDPSDADVDGSGDDVRNDGTLQASAGGRLELGGGLFNNAGGTIQALDASIVQLLSGAHVKNGTFASAGTGAVELQIGSTIEDITNTGTIRMVNGQDATLVGTITNNGTVEQNSAGGATDVTIGGDVTLTGPGTWTMTNHPNNRWLGAAATDVLTNDTSHTLMGEGIMLLPVVNNGAIKGASATNLIQLEGTVSGTGSLANVQIEATHSPGASPAEIELGGLYKMTAAATLEIEIGGPAPGTDYDLLDSTGDVTVDGTLRVVQIDLGGGIFQPEFGDTFVIITANGELNGEFDTLDAVNLTPVLVYEVVYDDDADVVTLGVDTFFDADFDIDGDVDGDDFLIWQSGFGQFLGGDATQLDGDADEDGDVDGDDFLVWQSQFGGSVGGNGSTAVPEPAAAGLLLFAIAAMGFHPKTRRFRLQR